MSNRHLTLCDYCGDELPPYSGVTLVITERAPSGLPGRIFPYQSKPTRDICETCLKPVAEALRQMEANREKAYTQKAGKS